MKRSLDLPRPVGVLYLTIDEHGRIKPGFTLNWENRIKAHQTGNAERLRTFRLYFPATIHDERFVHRELRECGCKKEMGEWYTPNPYFWVTIARIAKKMEWKRIDIGFDQPDLPFEA
jgi:hypothetical protein